MVQFNLLSVTDLRNTVLSKFVLLVSTHYSLIRGIFTMETYVREKSYKNCC